VTSSLRHQFRKVLTDNGEYGLTINGIGFVGNPAVKLAFGTTTWDLRAGWSRKMVFLRAALIFVHKVRYNKPEDSGSKIAVVTSGFLFSPTFCFRY